MKGGRSFFPISERTREIDKSSIPGPGGKIFIPGPLFFLLAWNLRGSLSRVLPNLEGGASTLSEIRDCVRFLSRSGRESLAKVGDRTPNVPKMLVALSDATQRPANPSLLPRDSWQVNRRENGRLEHYQQGTHECLFAA